MCVFSASGWKGNVLWGGVLRFIIHCRSPFGHFVGASNINVDMR